jgi:zinc transporter ZupT
MESSIVIVIGAAFLTAVMTGDGALPFLFDKTLGDRTLGWSNAAAAGLMLAASHSLIAEGFRSTSASPCSACSQALRQSCWPTVCSPIVTTPRSLI